MINDSIDENEVLLCEYCYVWWGWCNGLTHSSFASVGGTWVFEFAVKFYPPEPSHLAEDITR